MRLPRHAQLYCPYCYEADLRSGQIWFRCAGRISRDGRRCAPEADPVLRDRTGFAGALPPAFAGRRPPELGPLPALCGARPPSGSARSATAASRCTSGRCAAA